MSLPLPLLLSPALPSELLSYILNHHAYPTTVIICSTRGDFLHSLASEVHHQAELPVPPHPGGSPGETQPGLAPTQGGPDTRERRHQLLSSPLFQVAISRHVRTVYVPTVTHLRAYLSVFSPDDSKVPAPPQGFATVGREGPHLVVYGAIGQHRDTSEWSAQGLGSTIAALVEAAERLGWQLALAEPPRLSGRYEKDGSDQFANLLAETIPVLSGSVRRAGLDSGGGGWSGRAVEVGRVMSRWFRFRRGSWDEYAEMNQEKEV